MDAQQALADLAEISSQVREAVVFDDKGKVAASTAESARGEALAAGGGRLLAEAESVGLPDGGRLTQLEVATRDGSVFIVAEGKIRIAATTPPNPTVGLVFYDLKSALRSIAEKPEPAPKKRAPAKKAAPVAQKKAAPRKKKSDAP